MKLLDTDICIDVLDLRPDVSRRFAHELASTPLGLSSIVQHELWFGLAAGVKRSQTQALPALFSRLEFLPFVAGDAQVSAKIGADLSGRGADIGAYDTLIAGHALARGLVLVTANTRHFSRVDGLAIENWREPQSA